MVGALLPPNLHGPLLQIIDDLHAQVILQLLEVPVADFECVQVVLVRLVDHSVNLIAIPYVWQGVGARTICGAALLDLLLELLRALEEHKHDAEVHGLLGVRVVQLHVVDGGKVGDCIGSGCSEYLAVQTLLHLAVHDAADHLDTDVV